VTSPLTTTRTAPASEASAGWPARSTAACPAIVQPLAGRALDTGKLRTGAGIGAGLLIAASGSAAGTLPGLAWVLLAAVGIGAGTGLITPQGFAALATATPPERLGQTMGNAELGRELGDAGGPLLVAAVATAATLTVGYAAVAILLAAARLALARRSHTG